MSDEEKEHVAIAPRFPAEAQCLIVDVVKGYDNFGFPPHKDDNDLG